MYYSATKSMLVGFECPTLTSVEVAATNFLSALVALGFIDWVGRRCILLCTIPFMIMGCYLPPSFLFPATRPDV